MIITKLCGGLANQMFQYSAGRALALQNNDELKLDLSFYDNVPSGTTPRHYELDVYNIKAAIASELKIKQLTQQSPLLNFLTGLSPRLKRNKSHFQEKSYNFDPEILNLKPDIYLDGYWQTEKYFIEFKDRIQKDLTLKSDIIKRIDQVLLEKINNAPSVALHIRRGDYANDKRTNETHGICSIDYYLRGLKIITDKIGRLKCFVFSDDIDWCKSNLKIDLDPVFVDGNKSYEDLYLISQCRHQIIANSSFSWWGAWLNNNPDKIVIAPKKWFNKSELDTTDLIPSAWIKI